MLITLIDGYTDEPSCLGVPPFIAPYPRYIYGAVKAAGHDLNYITIDELRAGTEKLRLLAKSRVLIIHAGAIVPGKYLRGTPISFRETKEIAQKFEGIKFLGGSAARFGFGCGGGKKAALPEPISKYFDHITKSDLDACIYDYLTTAELTARTRTPRELSSWSVEGAELVRSHPDHPQPLVVELEAARGCVRYFTGGCSFCLEPAYGAPVFRPPEDIVNEVQRLYELGVRNFRLGAQSCIFSYYAKGIGESERPTPNPVPLKKLLVGIRAAAPNLRVFHLDNANPALIAAHPKKAVEIIKLIVENCTSGNVLSFGLESADPAVAKANNLNSTHEEVMAAIRIVNQYGSDRGPNGMPKLLPGLNFVAGLKGETKSTYELNYKFLKSILAEKLLLRRINLRQVLILDAAHAQGFKAKKFHRQFIKFKSCIRQDIDREMLKRLVPEGTILRDAFIERSVGGLTYARQLGTYPLLIGIPYKLADPHKPAVDKMFVDVAVTAHGYRSVTGIEFPFDINHATLKALAALPGIGRKRASRIVIARPFRQARELRECLDDQNIAAKLKDYIVFKK